MEIKGIKYICPCLDGSGYSEASRNYVFALLSQGIPLTIDPVFWDVTPPNLDPHERNVLGALINKPIDYNIVIMHVVPQNITHPPHEWVKRTGRKVMMEEGKCNILFTVWETDRLFAPWVGLINKNVDAVMVPCQWNKDVFEKSGIEVPVIKIPHCIEPRKYLKTVYPEQYTHNAKDKYTFYTIAQWASPHFDCGLGSRKRIEDLIRAFKRMFSGVPDVELVLKVYASDNRFSEQAKVEKWINVVLGRTNTDLFSRKIQDKPKSRVPNIVFEGNSLSDNDMRVLHQRGDCFILISSGEGFLLPAFEAACIGNPIITTAYGGALEYLNDDNAFLTNYTLEPVFGFFPAVWYQGTTTWASPDIENAAQKMKYVYMNPDLARQKGALAQKSVFRFTREKIGRLMVDEIHKL